jgi:cytochrome b involved in lipid metabolism
MPPKKKPIKRKGRKRRTATSLKIEFQNKRNKRHYSKRYLQKLNYIKLRDNYSCCMPGCPKPTGVKLSVHHCSKFSSNAAIRDNKYNLISLCYKCHLSVNGQEKKWEAKFKAIARRNEERYKKERKTKEQILTEQRKYQQLPDDFVGYQYKSDEEITKEKKSEYFMTKMYRLIKARVFNKDTNAYKNYGGRGIKMHQEWVDDFKSFEKYILDTLGDRPEDATIDRIDNEGNYEPGNLRWATAEIQGQNRRTTILSEESVAVIIILYYKYNIKISEILDKMNMPNRTIIQNVVAFKNWKNVTVKYKSIIKSEKILKLIEEYEKSL